MVLVSLNIHEKQLDMKLETVHQFIESEQPEKVHQKLSMCIKNEKVLITIGNQLLIREGA